MRFRAAASYGGSRSKRRRTTGLVQLRRASSVSVPTVVADRIVSFPLRLRISDAHTAVSAPAASDRRPPPSRPAATSSSTSWSPTTTSTGPGAPWPRCGDARFTAARVDASIARRRARPLPRARDHPRAQRGRSALRDADLRRCVQRRRRLPGHGDVAVAPAPRRSRTRRPASSSATSSSRWPTSGSGPAGWRWSASASSRACPTSSPGTPPTTCSRTIDEFGVRDGANLTVAGYDFAPSFSIWTTIEECLNPPVIFETRPRLVHHRAVLRAGGVRLPGGHRPGRVRQRRARRGAADPALGRRRAGHLQVRPRQRVHRGAQVRCTSSAWTRPSTVRVGGVEVAPRDVVAACLPDPATLGDRMTGKTCAGTWVTGTGKDGAPARGLPLPRRRQRVVDARVRPPGRGLADRDQPGRRAGVARHRQPGPAPACSARRRSTRCRSSTCSTAYGSPWGMREQAVDSADGERLTAPARARVRAEAMRRRSPGSRPGDPPGHSGRPGARYSAPCSARRWRSSTARSSTSRCRTSVTTARAPSGGLQWTVNAYLLPLAAFVLLGGALGDRFGRRRMFLIGVVWFTDRVGALRFRARASACWSPRGRCRASGRRCSRPGRWR